MKTITFKFSVGTRYVNSNVEDEIDLIFDNDATEEEIEKGAEEAWIDWRNENCDGGWVKLKEQ